MNNLDEYMQQDIYEYLNICDKIKCKKYGIIKDVSEILCYGCEHNIIEMINYAIDKGTGQWDSGLINACLGGHEDIINLMIKNGANELNDGLWGACLGGHIDIVELMIKKGANDWDDGLQGACGGNIEIIKMMINKGATFCNDCGKSMADHLKMK